MSRRFAGVLVLSMLACLVWADCCLAKPPDLPQNLIIIVHPIQMLPDLPPGEQPALAGQPAPPLPCQAAPDRFAREALDPNTTRSVLENLKLLIRANEVLEQARRHANEGELREAAECLEKVRALCPGRFDDRCDEVATLISAQLDLTWAIDAPPMRDGGEEEAEEPDEAGGVLGECLRAVNDFGRCWTSQFRAAFEGAPLNDGCGTACPKADEMHARLAKDVMVSSLLKAAHLAMDDGRAEKAAELARQAHALSPDRAEADPLVYKLHLLADKALAAGGEEAYEPKELPVHPQQQRWQPVQLVPNMPPVDTSGVEDVETKLDRVAMEYMIKEQTRKMREYEEWAQPRQVSFSIDAEWCKVLKATALQLVLQPTPPKDGKGYLMFGLSLNGKASVHTRFAVGAFDCNVRLADPVPLIWVTARK